MRLSSLRQKRGNKKNITRPQYFLNETGERPLKSWQREKRPSDFFAAPQSNRSEETGECPLKSGEEKIIVRPALLAVPKSRRSEETGARPP